MCGSLRYEGTSKKIGHILPVYTPEGVEKVKWLGHARSETIEKNGGLLPNQRYGYIYPQEYTERDIPFKIPPGKPIKVIITKSVNLPDGKGAFIITRPATTEELKKCPHPRHPRIINE